MISHNYQSLNNIPLISKQHIYYIESFDSDSVITYNAAITYIAKNTNKIYPSTNVLNQFTSIYYYAKDDSFAILFKKTQIVMLKAFITHS